MSQELDQTINECPLPSEESIALPLGEPQSYKLKDWIKTASELLVRENVYDANETELYLTKKLKSVRKPELVTRRNNDLAALKKYRDEFDRNLEVLQNSSGSNASDQTETHVSNSESEQDSAEAMPSLVNTNNANQKNHHTSPKDLTNKNNDDTHHDLNHPNKPKNNSNPQDLNKAKNNNQNDDTHDDLNNANNKKQDKLDDHPHQNLNNTNNNNHDDDAHHALNNAKNNNDKMEEVVAKDSVPTNKSTHPPTEEVSKHSPNEDCSNSGKENVQGQDDVHTNEDDSNEHSRNESEEGSGQNDEDDVDEHSDPTYSPKYDSDDVEDSEFSKKSTLSVNKHNSKTTSKKRSASGTRTSTSVKKKKKENVLTVRNSSSSFTYKVGGDENVINEKGETTRNGKSYVFVFISSFILLTISYSIIHQSIGKTINIFKWLRHKKSDIKSIYKKAAKMEDQYNEIKDILEGITNKRVPSLASNIKKSNLHSRNDKSRNHQNNESSDADSTSSAVIVHQEFWMHERKSDEPQWLLNYPETRDEKFVSNFLRYAKEFRCGQKGKGWSMMKFLHKTKWNFFSYIICITNIAKT